MGCEPYKALTVPPFTVKSLFSSSLSHCKTVSEIRYHRETCRTKKVLLLRKYLPVCKSFLFLLCLPKLLESMPHFGNFHYPRQER